MKITFIYPDVLLHRPDWTGYFYGALATLSAILKKEGYETSLVHITSPMRKSNFINMVKNEKPDLIGFSVTSHMFTFAKQYISWLVEAEIGIPIICGGVHPTIDPEDTIKVEGIDMICLGEGEEPLVELCDKMVRGEDLSNIKNIWIKRDGQIMRNPLRDAVEDLDSLPFPDRSIFNYQNLYNERLGRGSFMAARGCPYNCSYCCNHLRREIYGMQSNYVRYRSVDNVIAEVKLVTSQYPFLKTLIFDDDILFLKKKWAVEFAEKYAREIKMPFICNARANLIDEDIVGIFKKAGCYHVKFGLESGNEKISNEILNRRLSNDKIRKAFSICKKAGLITESFNMVGIPYETPHNVLDTIKLNAEMGTDKMQISIYQPYQGTKLAEASKEKGFVENKDLESDFFSPSTVKLASISSAQVLMFRDYFRILVYFYRILQQIPGRFSNVLIKISDRVLTLLITAKVLNILYLPLNFAYRRLFTLRLKAKIFVDRLTDQ